VIYGSSGDMNSPEVSKILSDLLSQVQDCKEVFEAQEVCAVLNNLSEMTCGSQEVRELLSALTPKVESCKEEFCYSVNRVLLFCA
jgi:polyhydroxyalkanoate synthesis regulator phasin